jgi:endonuclease/exonuclease/phosphatase family metal-dependent hydrolase
MSLRLRIFCWNIDEGRNLSGGTPKEKNAELPRIAEQIRSKAPDVVLLNELKNERPWPFGSGVNQASNLAGATGLKYCHWANTVATGLTGHKAVAVLSRYPIEQSRYHPVMRGTSATAYGTLQVTMTAEGLTHQIFSMRFDAHNTADNVAGHQQAVNLIRGLDPSHAVIYGGDFNAILRDPQTTSFISDSGLRDALIERPDQEMCGSPATTGDHIFFRGPYTVADSAQRCPWPGDNQVSDHAWVFAELVDNRPSECVQLRQEIQLRQRAIEELQRQLRGLNPRDPLDKQEIQKINAEISQLHREKKSFADRAQTIGCWL